MKEIDKEDLAKINNRVDFINLVKLTNDLYMCENTIKIKLPLIYFSILNYTKEHDITFYERIHMYIGLNSKKYNKR